MVLLHMNLISIHNAWPLSPAIPLPNSAVTLLAEIPMAVRSSDTSAATLIVISSDHLTLKLGVPADIRETLAVLRKLTYLLS